MGARHAPERVFELAWAAYSHSNKPAPYSQVKDAAVAALEAYAALELLGALDGIRWKSADRDNMEFAATITYVQMDAIRAALKKARGQ